MFLPTKYERETQLYVNDIYRGNYFLYENHGIEYLGTYRKGDSFRVKLKLLDDAVYYTNAWFYYIDSASMERFHSAMDELNSGTTLARTGGAPRRRSPGLRAVHDHSRRGWLDSTDRRRVRQLGHLP